MNEPAPFVPPAKKPINIGLLLLVILALASIGMTFILLQPKLPTFLTQPPTKSNTIANWQTFSDSDKGIEFQYPDTWTAQAYPGPTASVFLESHPFEFGTETATISTSIMITFENVQDDKGPVGQDRMLATTLPGQQEIFSKSSMNILDNFLVGGTQAAQLSGELTLDTPDIGGTYIKRTFVPRKDNLIVISLQGRQSESVYDQIISTFKFLNQNQGDVKNTPYTNATFGYTIHYPSGYEIPPVNTQGPVVIVRKFDDEEAIEITGFENTQRTTLDTLAKSPPALLTDVFAKGTPTKVKVNGLDALQITSQGQTFYIFTNGAKIIQITVNLLYTEELQSIVNSFAFKK